MCFPTYIEKGNGELHLQRKGKRARLTFRGPVLLRRLLLAHMSMPLGRSCKGTGPINRELSIWDAETSPSVAIFSHSAPNTLASMWCPTSLIICGLQFNTITYDFFVSTLRHKTYRKAMFACFAKFYSIFRMLKS